jgi:S-adenosylmethionine hydrolase
VRGEVLRVDRFGNLITNIDRRVFDRLGRPGEAGIEIRAGEHLVGRLVSTYSEIAPGEVCSLFGSTDHLEIAANSASAADTLALGRGAAVTVTRTS